MFFDQKFKVSRDGFDRLLNCVSHGGTRARTARKIGNAYAIVAALILMNYNWIQHAESPSGAAQRNTRLAFNAAKRTFGQVAFRVWYCHDARLRRVPEVMV